MVSGQLHGADAAALAPTVRMGDAHDVGLVVLDFGGPQGPAELVPFLSRLLHDVLPGPSALRTLVAPIVARLRARSVRPAYEAIGWSPIVPTHRTQVAGMVHLLGTGAPPVASGMMFTPPEMRDAVRALRARARRWMALPMFPHYSYATSAAAFRFFREALRAEGLDGAPVRWITAWPDHPLYVQAVAESVRAGIARLDGEGPVHLVFTPHGLPESFVRRGDPYPDHVRATIDAVVRHLGWSEPWHLGWQSRVGPARWLAPSTLDLLGRLGAEGVRRVCLVPVSFVSEHVETLYELDVEVARHAHRAGIAHLARAPALGASPTFLSCLADLVRDALATPDTLPCVRCRTPISAPYRACASCGAPVPEFLRPADA